MSGRGRNPADDAAEAAVGDLASVALFAEVLARINDDIDQILIFARVGLEISSRNLSLALGIDTAELDSRISRILLSLRADQEMAAALRGFHRAGRIENYQALAYRLGLQDWFCAQCGQFMVPAERGRRRKTCSNRCRLRQHRGHQPWTPGAATLPAPAATLLAAPAEMMSKLVQPIDRAVRPDHFVRSDPRWWQPETRQRDRAIVLAGLSCPVALSSSDIAALDVNDVVQTPEGVEVRLFRGTSRPSRYVIIPAARDRAVCPATTLLAWDRHLAAKGYLSGPLFPDLDAKGKVLAKRLTDRNVARIIEAATAAAVGVAKLPKLATSRPMLSFVYESERASDGVGQ
ncbi:hypothetical protein AB0G04_43540 [Actinoplanes sp. NPDC023801]|uniref:hypothetical protein n=1 Tax=Actinoplanes sp. NPDC023801 TaxID=3154595 RepID=UPI0033D71746